MNPPRPPFNDSLSGESMMSSSGGSITSTDMDNAMFLNFAKKDGSWESIMNSEERRRRAAGRFQPVRQLKERHAGRFDPVQGTGGFEKKGKMKRLEVSMRYQKFHNITSSGDSGLKKIPCKRLECEGMLINIGPTPKRAETKLQRAKERMMSLTRGKNLAFTHSCCFTCNVCADKPTPKHSWQRWCALCDAVYSNNGFFSHHGGNQGRGAERPIEKRIMQHKQNLWDLYVSSVRSNSNKKKQDAIRCCETLPMEKKWLVASFAFPHADMRSGIRSMNLKWTNETFEKSQSQYPIPSTGRPSSSSLFRDAPRFSTGRNFISESDGWKIREAVRQNEQILNNNGRISVGKPGSSLMDEEQLARDLDGVFSSMSAMSVDSRVMSVDTRPLSMMSRPHSINSNSTRPISLDGTTSLLINSNAGDGVRDSTSSSGSSLMRLGSDDLLAGERTSRSIGHMMHSERTDDTSMQFPLRSNTTADNVQMYMTE